MGKSKGQGQPVVVVDLERRRYCYHFMPISCIIVLVIFMLISSSSQTCFAANSYPFPTHNHHHRHHNRISYSNRPAVVPHYFAGKKWYGAGGGSVNGDHLSRRHRRSMLQAATPSPSWSPVVFSVEDFRAQNNGEDDTVAFKKAWEKACVTPNGVLVVPKGKTYRLKPVTLSGPCRYRITVKIYGTIEASENMSDYKDRRRWITFQDVYNLIVIGGGTIDGKGKIWWKNSCKVDKSKPCLKAPTAVTFYHVKNLRVADITLMNAQQMHTVFQKCVNVIITNMRISAPGDSPNTDGIHITASKSIQIQRSHIRTGDDCISIVSGSRNIIAKDITCGPGHGISIGSLGEENTKARVQNIIVDRATLSGTTNGVRIKSWQGGYGFARSIAFKNVVMHNVSNPIIIDQNYCDQDEPCREQKAAVQLSNIFYTNIQGTSRSDVAIKLDCSKTYPCKGVVLKNVNLVHQGAESVDEAISECRNVGLTNIGNVFPRC